MSDIPMRPYHFPEPPVQVIPQFPMLMPIHAGCICPPGANKECENPSCPRKPFNAGTATGEGA